MEGKTWMHTKGNSKNSRSIHENRALEKRPFLEAIRKMG